MEFENQLQKLIDNFDRTKKDIQCYRNLDHHLRQVNTGIAMIDEVLKHEHKGSLPAKRLLIAKNILVDLRGQVMQRMQ